MNRRVALVTGGAKGIGAATVIELANRGFSVAINYRTSETEACELVASLQSRGVNAIAVRADMGKRAEVERLYRECKSYFGFVDTLVNNAGVALSKLIADVTDEDYDYIMNNNLRSAVNACAVFAPDMVSNQFGRIVNVSSIWGEEGGAMESLYSASKAGVIGLTKALADELSLSGITVNAVTPGLIDTDMNKNLSDADKREFLRSVNMDKIGTPEEVAKVIATLTEEKSPNGAIIRICW